KAIKTNNIIIHEVFDIAFTLFPLALNNVKATRAKDAPIRWAMFSITVFVNVITFILSAGAFETIIAFIAGVWNPEPTPIRLIEINMYINDVLIFTTVNIIIPAENKRIPVPIIKRAENHFKIRTLK